MRVLVKRVALCLLLIVVTAIIITKLNAIDRDNPRSLPWQLPSADAAFKQHTVLADGRIKIEIEHYPLKGISPQMVSWFYQVLPISIVKLNGVRYPLYHLFHPSEHGNIAVLETGNGVEAGMSKGALVHRQEWFGAFDSQGAGRIIAFDDTGMTVKPEIAGLHFGEIRHSYTFRDGVTYYKVTSVIGAEWPVISPVINFLVRNLMFNEDKLQEWMRHQVEEVSSLQFFLADLYAQRNSQEEFKLER